jgi:hypothetical protein
MQVELLIYVATALALGFVVGYAMRALISRHRRRRARLSRRTEAAATASWRLERPADRPDFTEQQLRRAHDAPSMRDPAAPDVMARTSPLSERASLKKDS